VLKKEDLWEVRSEPEGRRLMLDGRRGGGFGRGDDEAPEVGVDWGE